MEVIERWLDGLVRGVLEGKRERRMKSEGEEEGDESEWSFLEYMADRTDGIHLSLF